ncbi:MAG TPA: Gfo/Idh/MocA family oxidoreductase [Firmicutes bacterium]|nr:Gfo/Idh/MocA family oxidoreductase [Bacillota bacterium]
MERREQVKPVGFAVVGLGMGNNRARQLMNEAEQGEIVRLLGVCDLLEEKARAAGEKYGVPWSTDYRRFLDDPEVEVIYVVTETGRHAKVAIDALEAGKHVLSTKPMEASLEAAYRELLAARKNRRSLAVDFDKRHTSATAQRIAYAIKQGYLGRILVGDSSLRTLRTPEYFAHNGGWRGTWALDGGGAMSNQAIHEIDLLYSFLGMPEKVEGRIWTQNHDIEAEDLGMGVWYYHDNKVGFVRATTCWPPGGWYARHELHGTEGAVIWSEAPQADEKWFLGGKWLDSAPDFPVDTTSATVRFARHIRFGDPMPVDGEEGLRSLAVLKAMYESFRRGAAVSPRELLAGLEQGNH